MEKSPRRTYLTTPNAVPKMDAMASPVNMVQASSSDVSPVDGRPDIHRPRPQHIQARIASKRGWKKNLVKILCRKHRTPDSVGWLNTVVFSTVATKTPVVAVGTAMGVGDDCATSPSSAILFFSLDGSGAMNTLTASSTFGGLCMVDGVLGSCRCGR